MNYEMRIIHPREPEGESIWSGIPNPINSALWDDITNG